MNVHIRSKKAFGAVFLTIGLLLSPIQAASGSDQVRQSVVLDPRGCIDDNDTGKDNCSQATDGLGFADAIAISPDGTSIYVVAMNDDAIVHFDRDTSTGALTPQGCIVDNDSQPDQCSQTTDGLDLPRAVAVSPDGESVYVASEFDHAIVVFDRDPSSGALIPNGCVMDNDSGTDQCSQTTDGLNGARAVSVSPDGESVYALSGISDDAIVHFERAADGDLDPQGCIDDNDTGSDTCAQSTDGLDDPAHKIGISPDGRSVYATSVTDDAVIMFGRDTSTGALTPQGCINDNDTGADACAATVDGLGNAISIASSSDGEWVYVASPADDAITRFDRDTGTGLLTHAGCTVDEDTASETCSRTADGLDEVVDIAFDPSGSLMYAASYSDDAMVAFDRDNGTGVITPIGCIGDNDSGQPNCAQKTDGLDGSRALVVSPDGHSVYVVGREDDAVVHFQAPGSEPPRCGDPDAICGGSEDEELQGTPEDEFIFGGGGNDEIDGGGGNDIIVGGAGNDVINGGAGRDKIAGGAGKDRVVGDTKRRVAAASRGDHRAAQAASAADQLSGGGGNDTVLGLAGNDKLKGDGGNDLLKGGEGVNDFNGGPGKDHCVLDNRSDETRSCEKKTRNFTRNFFPLLFLRLK